MTYSSTRRIILMLLLPATALAGDRPNLTYENYDELTENRAIFIRFVTNWCEQCDETQKDWDKLAKEWANHPIGFVAEVYCDTEEGELICEGYQVAGYPSVYYGDPDSPELYRGTLEYEGMASFAKENISTLPCSVKNMDACDSNIQKIIQKLQAKTQTELEHLEKQVLKLVEEEQTRFDKAALKLQQQYTDLADNFNKKIDKLRDESGFKWIQQLLNEMETENAMQEEDEGSADEL